MNPTTITAPVMVAACCTCAAAIWHHPAIVDGFLADHEPGRRPGCTATAVLEGAEDIDEVFALLCPPVAIAGQLSIFDELEARP